MRTSIRSLQKLIVGIAKKARTLELAAATNGSPGRSPRRKLTITPKRRAQLKLQEERGGAGELSATPWCGEGGGPRRGHQSARS